MTSSEDAAEFETDIHSIILYANRFTFTLPIVKVFGWKDSWHQIKMYISEIHRSGFKTQNGSYLTLI